MQSVEETGAPTIMISLFVTLWHELRSFLQAQGALPLEHEGLTPAEIAEVVRLANGDGRAHRFVWGYYYPRHYGAAPGALTDQEAAALVHSFKTRPEMEEPVEPSSISPPGESCALCGRRPGRGDLS